MHDVKNSKETKIFTDNMHDAFNLISIIIRLIKINSHTSLIMILVLI